MGNLVWGPKASSDGIASVGSIVENVVLKASVDTRCEENLVRFETSVEFLASVT